MLTRTCKDKDKDQAYKDQDKDKDLNLVLKESLRTGTRTSLTVTYCSKLQLKEPVAKTVFATGSH